MGDWLYSNGIISNNIITHNQNYGIGDRTYSNTTIDNNTISYNDCGIYVEEDATSLITYNNITFNYIGIKCDYGGNATVHWNNIHDNTRYGLENRDKTIEINATDNWWGSVNGPTHPSNQGGDGDRVSDYVSYEPWKTEPIEEAGPD